MPLRVPEKDLVLKNRSKTFISRFRELSLLTEEAAVAADSISKRPLVNAAESRQAVQDLANLVKSLSRGLSECMEKTAILYETLEKSVKRG